MIWTTALPSSPFLPMKAPPLFPCSWLLALEQKASVIDSFVEIPGIHICHKCSLDICEIKNDWIPEGVQPGIHSVRPCSLTYSMFQRIFMFLICERLKRSLNSLHWLSSDWILASVHAVKSQVLGLWTLLTQSLFLSRAHKHHKGNNPFLTSVFNPQWSSLYSSVQ